MLDQVSSNACLLQYVPKVTTGSMRTKLMISLACNSEKCNHWKVVGFRDGFVCYVAEWWGGSARAGFKSPLCPESERVADPLSSR
uniref:Uncharacterized protein n=1 Tax=Rhizophora mucronata TaxID=61149 RepID=A0A2P2PU07_RHIMU